ncbi:protein of unknown function [Candidatus Bipolaricaulis anaerobius]|uniref:Uncharacterized protein n=1 Tax=Candidatus Bipolaricaulis anaerobius TaxID=2026885 RepID=A0A2X3K5N4_9BACT|nr:protein of unknown function [Candidatus Bipolaricaulis anaerobius]
MGSSAEGGSIHDGTGEGNRLFLVRPEIVARQRPWGEGSWRQVVLLLGELGGMGRRKAAEWSSRTWGEIRSENGLLVGSWLGALLEPGLASLWGGDGRESLALETAEAWMRSR